ncbi:MAG TPA: hypothetical protein VGF75_01860 [Candidatus Saccharimonadales bacterium]
MAKQQRDREEEEEWRLTSESVLNRPPANPQDPPHISEDSDERRSVYIPMRPPSRLRYPPLPDSDGDDLRSVRSHASVRSTRSDLRRRQRNAEHAAKIQLMELEEKKAAEEQRLEIEKQRLEIEKQKLEFEKRKIDLEKQKIQMTLEKDLEDLQDEDDDLLEDLYRINPDGRPKPVQSQGPPQNVNVDLNKSVQDWIDATLPVSPPPSPKLSVQSYLKR